MILQHFLLELSHHQNPIEIAPIIKICSGKSSTKRQVMKRRIWELLKNNPQFTYERTSEIFITKGLKSKQKLLDFYPREHEGTQQIGSYISHIIVK